MAEKDSVSVAVKLTSRAALPPAEGANYFHFTVVGLEVQLLVGTVNLLQLHEARTSGREATVTPDITHRFLLSPLGFAHLKSQIDEIAKTLSSLGLEDGGVKIQKS